MAEIASNLTRYFVEFGDEHCAVIGRTEPVAGAFMGVLAMPEAVHGVVMNFYRIVNETTGERSEWQAITPGPSPGKSVTISVSDT